MSGKEATAAATHATTAATTVTSHAPAVAAGVAVVVQKVGATFTTDLPRLFAESADLGEKIAAYAAARESALELVRLTHTQAIAARGTASEALRVGSIRLHDKCSAIYGREAVAPAFPALPGVNSFDALVAQVGTLATTLPKAAQAWTLPAGETAVDMAAQVAQLTALKVALDQQIAAVRQAETDEAAALAESTRARKLLQEVPSALTQLITSFSLLGDRKDLVTTYTTHHHDHATPAADPAPDAKKPTT